MTAPSDGAFPEVLSAFPVPARMYDYCLGGKNNFDIDRNAVLGSIAHFPHGVDEARSNRQFLYRAVRFLARDAGIRQFLDMGSGLPTENNVHQVAQQFQTDARVVYVDNDPVVLSYGRALLATDDSTTVIDADMTIPKAILEHPQTQRLLDFSEPVAVLFLSVGHSIPDDTTVESMLAAIRESIVPGSYLAFTQMCAPDLATVEKSVRVAREQKYTFRVRLAREVAGFLQGLEPVEPGLVYVRDWRPDPHQPPLPDVDEPLRPYLGYSDTSPGEGGEFGGILRKP
jgi:S-adenosyl methyltransferase